MHGGRFASELSSYVLSRPKTADATRLGGSGGAGEKCLQQTARRMAELMIVAESDR
jgi:hypothetical protein